MTNLCDADSLLIAFSALTSNPGKPSRYDFQALLDQDDFATILVRDPDNNWYHGPVASGQWGPDALRDILIRAAARYKNVVCIGSSMGGYAAVLFGKLIGADRVLAFSPQIIIDPDFLRAIGEQRWLSELDIVARHSAARSYFDCSAIPAEAVAPREPTRIDLFVSHANLMDEMHAQRLSGQPGVTVHRLRNVEHNLIVPLRQFGLARRLIAHACGLAPDPVDIASELSSQIALRTHIMRTDGPVTVDRDAKAIRLSVVLKFKNNFAFGTRTDRAPRMIHLLDRMAGSTLMAQGLAVLTRSDDLGHRFEITIPYRGLEAGRYQIRLLVGEGDLHYDQIGFRTTKLLFDVEPEPSPSFFSFADGDAASLMPLEARPALSQWTPGNSETWKMEFPAMGGQIKTMFGRIDRDTIAIDAVNPMTGLFGPYVDLPPGRYLARMWFSGEVRGAGKLDVAADIGRSVLAEAAVDETAARRGCAEIGWTMHSPCDGLEVRLHCNGGFSGRVRLLEIERVGSPPS
jgi:hypothetical protein